MGGRRGQAGQTAAELMGVLLLVAVIVALLGGVADDVVAGVERNVCRIAGGECEDETPEVSHAVMQRDGGGGDPRPEYPPMEVPLGVPYPGSIALKGETVREDGVYAEVTGQAERSRCRINGEGKERVTVNASVELKLGRKLEGRDGRLKADFAGFFGSKTTYEVETDPRTAERIAAGEGMPNPLDPRTIPPDTGIHIKQDAYAGYEHSAAYAALRAQLGYKHGERVSAGVERVDHDTVKIVVGDQELVEHALSVGLGVDDANLSLSAQQELTRGKLRTVEIDFQTPEGWSAYQRFMASGELPPANAPGTRDAREHDVLAYQNKNEVKGKLGPFEGSVLFGDNQGELRITTNPDGSQDQTLVTREQGVTYARTVTVEPNGTVRPGGKYQLHLQDVDKSTVNEYKQLVGQPQVDGNRNVTLTLSDEQLLDVKRKALEQIAALQSDDTGGPLGDGTTPEQVEAYLREHPDGAGLELGAANVDGLTLLALARAEDPSIVLGVLHDRAMGNGDALLHYLNLFGAQTVDVRNGAGAPIRDHLDDFQTATVEDRPTGC